MISLVPSVIWKTFLHAGRHFFQSPRGKIRVRQEWANEMLSLLEYKLEVFGEPPSPDETHLIVGNHISFMDIPVLLSVFPSAVFIAKSDIKWWPILGQCIASAGTIFVSRGRNLDQTHSRSRIKNILSKKEGISVAAFPSGTTSLNESRPWKKGIFEIASETKTPVKNFRVSYHPLRDSAYIDNDNFISTILKIKKIQNKRITFTWLERYEDIVEPPQFAEMLRRKVIG